MWKLLRNVILAAVFVAGSLKLLAWYAVRQDSQRVIAGLAPYVQLKYAGISAGLNGSVTLDDVSATTAGTHKTYRARQLTFITPGLHWLLRRALLHENNLPQQFGIVVEGIELPRDLAWMDPRFLDQHSFAPFAAVGCGVDRFSAADYSKLGIGLRGDSERLDYSYNDATHILNTTLRLDAPGATGVVIAAEFSRFDPDQLRAPGWLTKLRLDQASVTYTDRGFQRARNRFCAARESISQSAFVDQHVTDVRALLKQHRITPNDALVELYRTVASEGGQVSVLSLPSKDFIPGSWKVLSANEVWRQLDVTARYGDSPPVMFGLDFATAPTVIAATTEESGAVAHDTAPTTPVLATPKAVDAASPPKADVVVVANPPPSSPPLPLAKPVTTAPTTAQLAASAMREPIAMPPKPAHDSLGLGGLDRAEAKLVVPTVAPLAPKQHALPPGVLPSSPPPPPNSTMALVWKPVIDELPETSAPPPTYRVIDIGRLAHEQGRRVRLITNGNIKVDGYVVGVDETGVQLRVDRGGGEAQFTIPRSRIEQVQLFNR